VQTLLDGVTVGGHRQTDELIATNQIKAWQFLFAAVEEGSFDSSSIYLCVYCHRKKIECVPFAKIG
jgi:hypothetical protein